MWWQVYAGWTFVFPSSQISRFARDRKSPTRPSKAPHSVDNPMEGQHREEGPIRNQKKNTKDSERARTPGTTALINILPTDKSLRPDCTTFRGSKTTRPCARCSATRFCSASSRSFAAALMNQRDDSTFARVITPSAMGRATVGSGCASEVSVRNASESNAVGG